MPVYTYKGFTKLGKAVKGTISADGLALAKQKAKMQDILLSEISEEKGDAVKKQSSFSLLKKISSDDLSLMTRQLATLVKAKIQIVEALSTLMDQVENPAMRVMLDEVRAKVNEGSSLARALSTYPKVFNNIYVNMVEAGEASGNLEIVLLRLADFMEGQVELKSKIKGALTYPVIMTVFGIIMIGIIFTFVIPKITDVFIQMRRELPLQTQICIWISNFIRNYWWGILAGIVALYFLLKKYIATEKGRAHYDKILLRVPILGGLVTMVNVSRFCSTLATLLNSGVPILTSMKIVRNLLGNVHMQNSVEESRLSVAEGASMTLPLIKSQLFPPMMTHMIRLGEKSGELEPMLEIVAENYENQVNTKLGSLTSVLQPIMMIIMGVVVGFIVFSVIAPMMELNRFR